jgi:hypothetical protein
MDRWRVELGSKDKYLGVVEAEDEDQSRPEAFWDGFTRVRISSSPRRPYSNFSEVKEISLPIGHVPACRTRHHVF